MTKQKPIRTYKTMYTFKCPVRGIITQEVEVKVYGAPVYDEYRYESGELADFLRQEGVISDTEDEFSNLV